MSNQNGEDELNFFGSEDILSQGLVDSTNLVDAEFNQNQSEGFFVDPLINEPLNFTPLTTSEEIFQVLAESESGSDFDYTIFAEGQLTLKGKSDFDGEPLISTDDAYIYAAVGFDFKSSQTLPILRNDLGEPILDGNGKQQLLDNAVVVTDSYSKAKANNNNLSGLIPPQTVDAQTLEIPAYADLVTTELDNRIPANTQLVTFDAKANRIRNANDWNSLFPQGGTAENPTYVRVTEDKLEIPNNVDLSNYAIVVQKGDIIFKGSNNELDNVVLLAEDGKLEAKKVNANNTTFLASDKIEIKSQSQFTGENLIANGSGKIEFRSKVTTPNETDSLRVISAEDLELRSQSQIRGQLLASDDLTVRSQSTFYGSLGAKNDIDFNSSVEVYATPTEPTTEITATIDSVTVDEGNGGGEPTTATLNVTLSESSTSPVSVDYATSDDTAIAGEDYTADSGTLTFEPGETSKTIDIPIAGDNIDEEDEAFEVELSNPDGITLSNDKGTVNIQDDDNPPEIAIDGINTNEASGTAEFTVSLTSASSFPVTVDFGTVDGEAIAGSDYIANSGTVTFEPGETSKTIAVEIANDELYENSEAFAVELSNPNNATIAVAEAAGTIEDDDELPGVTVADLGVVEGDDGTTTANFVVTLSAESGVEVSLDYATTDGSAKAGSDYVAQSGTLTFAPGETSKTISVTVNGDSLDEVNEAFNLNLSNLEGATLVDAEAIATIEDNDPAPELVVSSPSIEETDGEDTTATVTLTLSQASSKEIAIDYATEDGTAMPSASSAIAGEDYTASNGTITFAPGETTKTIEVGVLGDIIDEIDEAFTVNFDNPNNVTLDNSVATVSITDNDALPAIEVANFTTEEGNENTTASFTLTLNNPSSKEISVDFTTADGTAIAGNDYIANSGTITFAPGETSKTVEVEVLGDITDEIDEAFTINLTNPSNASLATTEITATIEDNDAPPIAAIANISLNEGNEGTTNAELTVTLDNPSGKEITIDYATENDSAVAGEDYTATNGTITFEPGETSKTIAIPVIGDDVFEGDEAFKVNLSNPSNVVISSESGIATVTIANDDTPALGINFNLANDTGIDNTDKISSDATITGNIENLQENVSLRAFFTDGEAIDKSDLVQPDGSFTLGIEDLEEINGGDLGDGTYTLNLAVSDGGNGTVAERELTFTLDTAAPSLELTVPLADGNHSNNPRLIGEVGDDSASLSYSLDGSPDSDLAVDETGKFDSSLGDELDAGTHNVTVTATDIAGNQSSQEVSFQVGDSFFTPDGTNGWGAVDESTVILGEQDSFVVQTEVPVELGLDVNEEGEEVGTRTISFDLDAVWDETDAKDVEDQLLVYLVDPANPSQTLLDNGTEGSAVFSVAGEQSDFTPGLVSFDGTTVTIDASSLTDVDEGLLVFQLLNQDNDTGSVVTVNNLASTTDLEDFANPIFPQENNAIAAGGELNLANLNETSDVETVIGNVSFDASTGEYKALVSITNNGEAAISRNSTVIFNNLPDGVELASPSGIDGEGNPYINLRPGIGSGGLGEGETSQPVEVVFTNPNLIRFGLDTTVLVGSSNVAPVFEPIDPLTVIPGEKLELNLAATDANGDSITYRLDSEGELPTGTLEGDGTLRFNPKPNEIGSYEFIIIATDGVEEVSQTVTIDVVADPITTTRISGVIENVEQEPLAGVPIELGEISTVTAADGSFTIETDQPLTADTLIVRGEEITGDLVYPYIAEKLPLVLGQGVYEGFHNTIDRPIYLPALDVDSGQEIDPTVDTTVTSENIPGSSVFVEAGSLSTQEGEDFTGTLSITEVPNDLTPAALPENLSPDMVVTIQPGEMAFNTPAPLSLPNLSGYAPGTEMDLWSINPETGDFDNVGMGIVSDDGSVVETVDGGIRNSSWHFFAPPPEEASNNTPPPTCNECQETAAFKSEVELNTGAVIEDYDLVSYSSNGESRGVTLTYDSLRADPRPIVQFGYDDLDPSSLAPGFTDKLRIMADWNIKGNDGFDYQVPGFAGGQYGLNGGEHFWSLPNKAGDVDFSLQADLSTQDSGKYDYTLNSGIRLFVRNQFVGSSSSSESYLLHVNSIDSAFGSGWGIAGWQEIVENSDGSLLLIDGDGSELLFEAPETDNEPYIAPPGDYSVVEKLPDGTFERTTTEQMVYVFNQNNKLQSVTDTNSNTTEYIYDESEQLTKIVDPVGLETVFTYNDLGQVSSITDPVNKQTLMEYDESGNLTSITNPDDSTSSWSYDDGHHMISEVDPMGNVSQASYDQFGRATSATTEDGSVVRVDPVQTQGLYPIEATANPLTSPQALVDNAELTGTYADANGNVVQPELDAFGQRVGAIDGGGNTGTVERNEENLITSRTDAKGFETNYTYDEQGNVISITEQLASGSTADLPYKALQFDGIDDAVENPIVADIANTFTLEFWVNPTATRNSTSQRNTGISGIGNQRYAIAPSWGRIIDSGHAGAGVSVGTNGISVFEHSDYYLPSTLVHNTPLSGWNHIAIVYDNKTPSLYLNGQFIKTGLTSNYIVHPSLALGDTNNGYGVFEGQIDEIRLWNFARTEEDIQLDRLYSYEGNESGLAAYLRLDEGEGNLAIDLAENQRNGTLVNGTSWINDAAPLVDRVLTSELIYSEDFESGIGNEWSNDIINDTYPEIFTSFAGRYSNGSQTLTLDTIPGETYSLEFDLYAIDSWDGSSAAPIGPDNFEIWLDGVNAFQEPVSINADFSWQSTNLQGKWGFTEAFGDGIFPDVVLSFTAENDVTEIRFADGGLQGLADESWGIDNVEIYKLILPGSNFTERSYTYDPTFNQLTSETDELGRQTLYDIDPDNGNLLSTTQVVGEVGDDDDVISSYTYTDAGLIDTMTDPLGRVTDYDYDAFGNLISETYAVGTPDEASVNYEYDASGNQTAMIDPNGNRNEYQYDEKNRLVKSIYAVGTPDEAVETTEYDGNGNQVATVDGNGNRTEYEYDEKDRLIQTIAPDPDGDGELTSPISTSTYDGVGNLVSTTDPLGRETRYIYDSRNRLVETILPDGTTTKSKYDRENNLTSATDAAGETTRQVYDSRDRLIGEVDPQGNITRYEYDAADQLVAIVDGNDNRSSYQYDELGRQIAVIDGEGNITRTEYDKAGNVVATIDGLDNRTEYEFDERDRNTVVTDAEGGTTITEYDDAGNVLSVTDPVNNQTSYTYDAQNRVAVETNELGFTRTFEYDDVGNSISTTDRNGREREFVYDGLNRQVEENWLDNAGNSIRTTNSEYDGANQLIATDDPNSAYNFTYDELGRVVMVDNAGTPGVPNVVLTYNYDESGNIISVSDTIDDEAGATTAYNYDELDRVDLITQSGENVADKRVDFDYDAIGQYESVTRYSDLSGTNLVAESSYTYDDANRLTNLNHSNDTTEIANYDLTYDAANRITQIVDPDGTNDYSYDQRDQLTAAERSDESNADETYSYDENGNRTDSSLHGSGYVTDANNRLVSDGTFNYEYDNQGNLIRQTEIATGNVQEMEWDYLNRLVAVADKDAGGNETQKVEFTYDMFGRRLSKTVDGEATYFVYDRDNVILDFVDADGTEGAGEAELEQRYLHGDRIDQILAQEDGAGDVNWHLTDHLGSVKDLVDNNGDAVDHYVYDSFGNVVSMTGETVISRYLYTGREWDEEIGLQFNRGRFYNPELGIFINEDPIGFSGGTPNLYGYVENNPINATDPSGTRSYELTQLLLNYSHPRQGQRSVHIYNTKFTEYYSAFVTANNWYLMITEPPDTYRNLPNSPIPWVTQAPLKTSTEGEGGKAILRPIGTGGGSGQNSDVPTIQLRPDERGQHNTPGRKKAGRIKFEWDDDDKSCPFIPLPVFSRDGLNVGDQPGFGANPVPSGRRIPDIDIPIPIPVPVPVPIPFPFPKY